MNKRGELKNNELFPKIAPRVQEKVSRIEEELSNKHLKRIIVEMLAEMKLGSGKVIASFQALTREMLEKNYEVSWGYGKLYPFDKLMQDVTAYVQSKVKNECRLLLEGKIIFLSCGFFKSSFPEATRFRPDFKTLSLELLKGKQLTTWLTPGEEPKIVTIYIVPTIHLKQGKPLYFIVGEIGIDNFVSGGFAEKLADTKELVSRLASELLRKKMVHAVPKSRQTPVTGINMKVPFLKRV